MNRKLGPPSLSRAAALTLIRELSADSSRIVVLNHALRRMRERRITRAMVESCLRRGVITEGPALDLYGNWTCRMERLAAGEQLAVAVAIERQQRLLVITVI